MRQLQQCSKVLQLHRCDCSQAFALVAPVPHALSLFLPLPHCNTILRGRRSYNFCAPSPVILISNTRSLSPLPPTVTQCRSSARPA